MDVREKLVELLGVITCPNAICNFCENFQNKTACERHKKEVIADHMIANGATVQEWISVKDHTPTEADGTVWVCLADVFPYNEKEPYIDAKHDRRITEANYSKFSKQWYKEGAIFPEGIVTHWMEKPQPPKGE